ncbi:MAG: copper amine oxidase N-terminal domain-containing protein [Candidatus Eremiobacterota bacterium]
MKKFIITTISLSLLLICLTLNLAAQEVIRVYIDGRELFFDVPPAQKDGYTLVPLRAIFNGLGATVKYDSNTRTITSNKGTTTVQLTLDSTNAYVNGQIRKLDMPAMSINERTLVPLRFVGEAFGAKVKWDGKTRSIFISTEDMQGTPQAAPAIYAIMHSATGNLGGGDVLTVTLIGTPGSRATFDIPGIVTGITMNEVSQGKYEGTYTVKSSDRGTELLVTGYLSKDNSVPATGQSEKKISMGQMAEDVKIISISHNGSSLFRPGDVVEVIMTGTAGGQATFDIGNIIKGVNMAEIQAGTYKGTFTVRGADNISNGTITGYLKKDNTSVNLQDNVPVNMGSVQPTPAEEIKISSLTHNATKPLKKGDELRVTLKGTGGCTAFFDITNFKSNIPMTEIQPGIYEGIYRVLAGDSAREAYLLGHITKNGKDAPVFQTGPVTVAGISPVVSEVSPKNGSTVESDRPNIYVTFDTQKGSLVNPQTVKLLVDGVDVTGQVTKAPMFISYNPANPLPLKRNIWVELTAQDENGNSVQYGWSFVISPAAKGLIFSASHNGQLPLKTGQKLQVTMYGVSGCVAWFEIIGLINITMKETASGIYYGEYPVTSVAKASGAKIIVHLKNQTVEDTLVVEPPVTFDVEQGFNAPNITSIQSGQKVVFPVEIKGYTKPYATVEITYEYQTSLFNVLPVKGVAGTKRISADEKGYFYDKYTSIFGSGTQHTITVIAIDSSGNKSPQTVITVTEQ